MLRLILEILLNKGGERLARKRRVFTGSVIALHAIHCLLHWSD
jgi:hypothetical protein